MRQFSELASVATGIGMAFVSTIYGLALANLLLLPAANRIRAAGLSGGFDLFVRPDIGLGHFHLHFFPGNLTLMPLG